MIGPRLAMVEGQPERAAGGYTDGLAIERVAAAFIKDDPIHAEGRRIAERRANIVVVGDVIEDQQCLAAEQIFQANRLTLSRAGQHAAVNGKSGDRIHYCLRRDIDGHIAWQARQNIRQRFKPRLADENAVDREARPLGQD